MADKRDLTIILLVAVIILLAFLAVRSMMYNPAYGPGGNQPARMGPGMMYGPGYSNNYSYGPMMYGPGYNRSYGPGMMYGYNYSYGPGMMGDIMALYYPGALPVTNDTALRSLQSFARRYGSNVEAVDVMAFSSNYYAILRNATSGQYLAEVIVDRYSGSAYPEPGPNMMWNTLFGAGRAQAGGSIYDLAGANRLAENFLQGYLPGARTQDANALPGYYTFNFGRGKVEGMLSVNTYSGQIWVHTWHGFYLGSMPGRMNMTG